jgi:16S rRNA (guanine(966)-N(2))-methyltransferase RsmD
MSKRKGSRPQSVRGAGAGAALAKPLRIIGGTLRGHGILYSGDPRTRPMKDRLREAVFDVLATAVVGKQVIDLFAGTGALSLEAISRGAARATLIERHFPTARLIEQNITQLGLADRTHVHAGDAFLWARQQRDWTDFAQPPWLVLCSPPYAFYTDRTAEMVELIFDLCRRAPADSEFVVETDQRFDFALLADLGQWDVRPYPPAILGFHRVR